MESGCGIPASKQGQMISFTIGHVSNEQAIVISALLVIN